MLSSMGSVKQRKIVLIGATGMLGHALQGVFQGDHLTSLTHAELDITDSEAVIQCLSAIEPEVIINAAAYTKVDDCEHRSDLANAVNGSAVGNLAKAAKLLKATFIHYSTDYIFDGKNSEGYLETETGTQPVNAYGASKLLGEQALQAFADETWRNYYLIRTAWLFGTNGPNFVDTMRKLAITKTELKVVNDQHGSPTYAGDLAAATKVLVDDQYPFGIYHITNSGTCTWCDFAQEIFNQCKLSTAVIPCSSAEFPRPAKRPMYSMLRNTKFPPLRSWQEALKAYLSVSS